MDAVIIVTLLIMFCVIIAVMLSEMQRLNEESEKLRKELEKVETQRDAENTRHKSLQKALRDRLEEVREALSTPNTKPVTISEENEELKPLHFAYCMRYDERKELEEKYQGMGEGARRLKAQHVIMPQVMTEVEKRITESFDARHQETTYAVDIWVHK